MDRTDITDLFRKVEKGKIGQGSVARALRGTR
jgi:stalled ribosome alternative rescue factor ArfA